MKNKSFAVIGLGQFGMTLAVTLAESDCDVLAIDDKEENIEEISEKVTYAVKADAVSYTHLDVYKRQVLTGSGSDTLRHVPRKVQGG